MIVTMILAAATISPIVFGLWLTRGDVVTHTTQIQLHYCRVIKHMLDARNIHTAQLARDLKCSENHLKQMLNCKIDMPLHWVEAIGVILGMDFRIVCIHSEPLPTPVSYHSGRE